MIDVRILADKDAIGALAAETGARAIREALATHGQANIIVATGVSQFDTLKYLVAAKGVDWSKVTAFHLDEYVGLSETHPASFRRFLRERFVVPVGGAVRFVPVSGQGDPAAEVLRLNALIKGQRIDVCFAGFGENCHLAFNDPPADFETEEPYIIVTLDEACRRQQLGEGWFPSLDAVPTRAISMSIRQILKSELVILSVPDERKARAVRDALEAPVSPLAPASILQTHPRTLLLLDPRSASLLKPVL